MRRHEKEITDTKELNQILDRNMYCHMALCEGGRPYILPMNYGFDGTYLYLHSASEGRKTDIIRINNLVSFEVSDSIELKKATSACSFTTAFCSVIGKGVIEFITKPAEKKEALGVIVRQADPGFCPSFPDTAVQNTCVMRIVIHELTGKKSP